jgi:hypothetical protein
VALHAKFDTWPPIKGAFSTIVELMPRHESSQARLRPVIPPPIMSVSFFIVPDGFFQIVASAFDYLLTYSKLLK